MTPQLDIASCSAPCSIAPVATYRPPARAVRPVILSTVDIRFAFLCAVTPTAPPARPRLPASTASRAIP